MDFPWKVYESFIIVFLINQRDRVKLASLANGDEGLIKSEDLGAWVHNLSKRRRIYGPTDLTS